MRKFYKTSKDLIPPAMDEILKRTSLSDSDKEKMKRQRNTFQIIKDNWESAAEEVSIHGKVTYYDEGKIRIEANNMACRTLLKQKSKTILSRYQQLLPFIEINELSIYVKKTGQ